MRRVSSSWPDPARTSLSWWLVAIHLSLVLLVAGGMSWTASRMLQRQADEQGKARVQLAATMARENLRRLARRCSGCWPKAATRRSRPCCAVPARPRASMAAQCSPIRR